MIENNANYCFEDLYTIFGEESLFNLDFDIKIIGVSIDTRNIKEGNIFIAFKGENVDGHSKIIEAFEKGAKVCIVEEDWFNVNKSNFENRPFIVVKNSLNAIGELATFHRTRFNYPVIAVAGSNGKTTTKELISSVLSKKGKVLKTYMNYNNQLGVPLMLLSMTDEFDFLVLEIATNEPGEIMTLCKISNPNFGIITNIGKEHLEKLFDIDGVEMEETSLIAYLLKHGGFAFINGDDIRLAKYTRLIDKHLLYGTLNEAHLKAKAEYDNQLQPTIQFQIEETTFNVKLKSIGYAGVINATAAVAVGLKLDVPYLSIIEALEEFEPQKGHGYGRMVIEQRNGFKIINDCYNANPSSMSIALDMLNQFDSNRKIAILGDMRELGDASEESHLEILEKAISIADLIFTFGDNFILSNNRLKNEKVKSSDNKNEMIIAIQASLVFGDTILLKGSRGTKMEEILEHI